MADSKLFASSVARAQEFGVALMWPGNRPFWGLLRLSAPECGRVAEFSNFLSEAGQSDPLAKPKEEADHFFWVPPTRQRSWGNWRIAPPC